MDNKIFSYLFGLLVTDGTIYVTSRNRGKVSLELSKKDEEFIDTLVQIIPNSYKRIRVRDTNFKNNYESVSFIHYRKEFRDMFISKGFPLINKTSNACTPTTKYDEISFWRGVIDGDGSLGYKNSTIPILSLTTKSENLKNSFLLFLQNNFSIKKNINRNVRDNIYNICLTNEDAVNVTNKLYNKAALYLPRKYKTAMQFQSWVRTFKKQHKQSFSTEEIEIIKTHTVEEAMKLTGRTKQSIKCKKFRLMS